MTLSRRTRVVLSGIAFATIAAAVWPSIAGPGQAPKKAAIAAKQAWRANLAPDLASRLEQRSNGRLETSHICLDRAQCAGGGRLLTIAVDAATRADAEAAAAGIRAIVLEQIRFKVSGRPTAKIIGRDKSGERVEKAVATGPEEVIFSGSAGRVQRIGNRYRYVMAQSAGGQDRAAALLAAALGDPGQFGLPAD